MVFSLARLAEFNGVQRTTVALLILAAVVYAVRRHYKIYYPDDLPRVREGGRTRFRLRTRLAYYIDCRNLMYEAYSTYSKNGKSCLMPGLGFRDEVLLPVKSLRWLTSQPESRVSVYDSFREMDLIEWVVGHHKYISDPWQGMLVRRDMNRVLESLMVALNDELAVSFDQRLGHNTTEWKEFNLYETMGYIVAQASSRFTVGLPLCRNEEYLKYSLAFGDHFVLNAGLVGLLPKAFRPILAPIIALPFKYGLWKIEKLFKPLFDERMKSILISKEESVKNGQEPQDHLQMMMRLSQTDYPDDLNLHDITRRLSMSNLGSMHQTKIAITNVIFNILESDPEYNTIALIREEVSRVLGPSDKVWSKANIAKMVRIDSILRETLRIVPFGNRAVIRKILVDDLRTEDGILLPKGALVSILSHPVQCDEDNFEDPMKFDPFRFSRLRAEVEKNTSTSGENETSSAGFSFVATGSTNLPFGHGKHACPGRFLVDFELKMVLTYLVTNYDFELLPEYRGKRPESPWVAEAIMPPAQGKVRVKRRSN